ncbi:hypothetical protein GCM10023350_14830 [Nocardioides endophyticus]|uniref:eCIS core domain-containing protein n=1 Tax=Nocardioides endophyticus TaxID=1353775 RepID=A0ABP8YP44_9ACTN
MGPELAPTEADRPVAEVVPAQPGGTSSPENPVPLAAAAAAAPVPMHVGDAADQAEKDADLRADQALARLRRSSIAPTSALADDRHDPGCTHLRRLADQSPPPAAIGLSGGAMPSESASAIDGLRPDGQALAPPVRRRMEEGFGVSFADVRVHDGPSAAQLSQSVGARAFTTGRDVFFGRGQYAPHTPEGERVLAHELAHTLQPDQSLRRLPARSEPVIRRLKLLPVRNAPTIHVNDYHFIDRMRLGNAPKSGEHDVVIKPFDDFEGLAIEAATHPGDEFEFDGITWGWRGATEIFPIADKHGKVCVRLSAEQISELKGVAGDDDIDRDVTFATIRHELGDKVGAALAKVTQKPDPHAILPLRTTPRAMKGLPRVSFAEGRYWNDSIEGGGDNFQAFMWGPNGSKEEGPHLHLFFECKAKHPDAEEADHPITLKSFIFTTKSKQHLTYEGGVFRDKKGLAHLSESEYAEVEELLAVSEMLIRADSAAPSSDALSDEKDPEALLGDDLKEIGKGKTIRMEVLKHFFLAVAQVTAEDISSYVKNPKGDVRYQFETWVEDLGELERLDVAAAAMGFDVGKVNELLTAEDYPYEKVSAYYDKLIDTLTKKFEGASL